MHLGFLLDWLRRIRRWDPKDGQSLVEYSLILALVVVVVIVIIMTVGNQTKNMYCNITAAFGA